MRRSGGAPAAPIEARDLALLGELMGLGLLAWVLPERSWAPLARGLGVLRQGIRRDLTARVNHAAAVLEGRQLALPLDEVLADQDAHTYLERLQLLRLHRPGGWTPRLSLEGGALIDRGLAAGSGVILWVAALGFHRQATKMALFEAGYRASHLSRWHHGFHSFSRFGERVLNPLRTAAENRFLAERIVIGRGGESGLLDGLARRLKENGMLSITVGAEARRVTAVPFLGGRLPLAGGPVTLALRTGAPLLPVFTLREPDGGFTTRITPPLALDRDAATEQAVEAALTELAGRLEAVALSHPDQFNWHDIRLREG